MGFAFFMSLGRRAYHVDLPASLDGSKPNRRIIHAGLMVTAGVCIAVGYAAIYIPHKPMGQFFGYDFKQHQWKPFLRVLHVYLGYAAIVLVIYQMIIGYLKMKALSDGLANYPNHALIGVSAHYIGMAAVLVGLYIMPWSLSMRLVVGCCIFCIAALVDVKSVQKQAWDNV